MDEDQMADAEEQDRKVEEHRLRTAYDRSAKLRSFYKWILDFLRNMMVVVALLYVAKRSGSNFAWGLGLGANFVLCAYCFTYVDDISTKLDLWRLGKRRRLRIILEIIGIQAAMVAISIGLFTAVDRIVNAQG